MKMFLKRRLAVWLALLLSVTALGACVPAVSPTGTQFPLTTTPTASPSRPIALTVPPGSHPFVVKTATVKSAPGLELTLSVNTTVLRGDESLSVTISERNTLEKTNRVAAADQWPLQGLVTGPCGTLNYPVGIALFKGVYSGQSDFTGTTRLKLYNPDLVYHCPAILSGITAYEFQPSSTIADVYGDCGVSPCITDLDLDVRQTLAGGYTTDPTVFWAFSPGYYTIIAGDEWGALAFLNFEVVAPDASG
jgi:hypothetical protein